MGKKCHLSLCSYYNDSIVCVTVPDLPSIWLRVWFNRVGIFGVVEMVGSSRRQKLQKFPVFPELIRAKTKCFQQQRPTNNKNVSEITLTTLQHHIRAYTHHIRVHTFQCHLLLGFWSSPGSLRGSIQNFHIIDKDYACVQSAVSLSGRDVALSLTFVQN